jgi:hypothetical protein
MSSLLSLVVEWSNVPFFDIYFLGSSLVDNNPSLIRYMDIYKLEIPGFDWLCGKSIEQLLSLFGS